MKKASGSKPINLKRASEDRNIGERISRRSLMNQVLLAHADANLTQNHNIQLQIFCGILKPPKRQGSVNPVPRQRHPAREAETSTSALRLPPGLFATSLRVCL